MSILTRSLEHLVARCLPSSCLLCGNDSGESVVCAACAADCPHLPPASCPRCAEPIATGECCGRCLKHPPHFDRAYACFLYAFPLDHLIQALKYRRQLALAGWFARQLAKTLPESSFDLIIPLPLHPERLQERGFNQSGEIARSLAALAGTDVDYFACCRVRPTHRQADTPLKERRRNVRGAFECRSDLSGRRILLIDDVMTSGATVDECARILKLHGATEVTVGVIARTALKD